MENKKKPRAKWNGQPARADISGWHWVGRKEDGTDMVPAEWCAAQDADEGEAGWGLEEGPFGSVDTSPAEMPRHYPFYFGVCPRPDAAREMAVHAYDKAANRLLALAKRRGESISADRHGQSSKAFHDAVMDVVREISPRIWRRITEQERAAKRRGKGA